MRGLLKQIIAAVLIFGLTFTAAAGGTFFTIPGVTSWYQTLEKPWFTPPAWIFSPVWTALYIMMALAAYLAWMKGREPKGVVFGLTFYFIQLFLNFFWSFVFFGLQSFDGGFFVIALLWANIVFTMIAFWKLYRPSGYLLIPYLLWVTFASILNYYVGMLNT